ncbi:MAG: SLBB domain-containing protein [Alphaproteobacteria bacterium]
MKTLYYSFFAFFLVNATGLISTNTAQAQPPYAPWMDEQTEHVPPPPLPPMKPAYSPDKIEPAEPQQDKEQIKEPLSALERMYTERIMEEPKQFGYDFFTRTASNTKADNLVIGKVHDSFILGTGDELLITFRGQRNDMDYYTIDTRGIIMIDDFSPVFAAGKTIAHVTEEINRQTESLHNTKAYISLSSVRQINVLVIGHVQNPGRKTLNAFHSVIDALDLAGGIEKNGSLRAIKHVRNGRSTYIDLYNILMHGTQYNGYADFNLQDGDRLIIPPIGPTIAVTGAVKRPGIYEIRPPINKRHIDQPHNKLSLNDLLSFAGGVLSTGNNKFLKLESTQDGHENITQITDQNLGSFKNNTILSVSRGKDKKQGTIRLIGQTRSPGFYDIGKYKMLSDLLDNGTALDDDIYPLIGLIKRWDDEQLTTHIINFPIRSVLNNNFDIKMHDSDMVILLSNSYISGIYKDNKTDTRPLKKNDKNIEKTPYNIEDDDDVKNYLLEHSVHIHGAVRNPGHYPISSDITLENLLASSGGMTINSDERKIEIISPSYINDAGKKTKDVQTYQLKDAGGVNLSSGDIIRVNQKHDGTSEKTITIVGEVLYPGEYTLITGEKTSDLIKRAGGLNDNAYPAGAIFSRASERKAEKLRFRTAAHDMEQRLASAIERDKTPPNATQIKLVRDLADKLNEIEAIGRITVEANPDILSVKPELDMLLEGGDKLYIPKRPLIVRVRGEVLSPSNQQFREEKSPRDYIRQAGDFSYHADKDRAFVLYPDGSAEPLRVSNWNHRPIFIPPGSTIIIPRDPKPFDFIESAKEIGQILSNLAVTSVFIDDIRD